MIPNISITEAGQAAVRTIESKQKPNRLPGSNSPWLSSNESRVMEWNTNLFISMNSMYKIPPVAK